MGEVSMGTWVKVDDCPIHYTVCHDVIEFELGGWGSGVELVATEAGLTNLLQRGAEALTALRGEQHGA
ncbi:hypothetical protein DFQ14_11718 [Halopolyspora algeriensis]|uniref:Uncharacterized protein n=1 Tax=Halopolyspora algeriensis TaxID=1500506 RepID=A0A368VDJ6_9ACTN|nr:hypothetical protein [Halopolyspora algeriensis]RCW39182.1 hypothetical protein DFQ14_11718 [Halopolyspora algeriensis]TQM47450.1 hypothetical protein FHU43_3440 [Halopolyspora algeriensis]